MIEGLKVTIQGPEMVELCVAAADHHAARARVYAQQIESMRSSSVESVSMTGGDPIRALTEKKGEHENAESEMRFVAAHIDLSETYILDWDALRRLGIVKYR